VQDKFEIIENVDFHCSGRFPRARLQPLPLAMLSPGSSVLADSAGKIGTKEFGANLCDEASEAMQEQMFYAPPFQSTKTTKYMNTKYNLALVAKAIMTATPSKLL